MRSISFVRAFVFLVLVSAGFSQAAEASCAYRQDKPGVLDLRDWDFAACPYLRLSGDYQFFWQKLLSADELHTEVEAGHSSNFAIPGIWLRKRYQQVFMEAKGFASYYTKVLLPSQHPKTLTFYMWEQPTATNIWVNDKKILELGGVGSSLEEEKADRRPRSASFQVPSESFDLVFQVSNFHLGAGGLWHAPLLGVDEEVSYFVRQLMVVEAFGIGAVLFISLYYLILWFFQRDQKSYFYFATFGILIFVRGLFSGSEKLYQYFYPVPFEWCYRIEYVSFYFIHFCVVHFIHLVFQNAYSKMMLRLVQFSAYTFSLVTLFSQPAFFTQFLGYYQVLWVIYFLYLLIPYWQGKWRGNQGTLFFMISFFIPFVAGVHDIFINESPFGIPLFSHGLAIAMLMHASVLSKRFTSTFEELRTQESLNRDLSQKMHAQNQEFQRREIYQQIYQKLSFDEIQRAIEQVKVNLAKWVETETRDSLISPLELYRQTLLGRSILDSHQQNMAQSFLGQELSTACRDLVQALSDDQFTPLIRIVSDEDNQQYDGDFWHWVAAMKLLLIGLKQSQTERNSQFSLLVELKNHRLVMEVAVKPLLISERRKTALVNSYTEVQAELEFLGQADPLSRAVFLARRIVLVAGGDFHILTNRAGETRFSLTAGLSLRTRHSVQRKSA